MRFDLSSPDGNRRLCERQIGRTLLLPVQIGEWRGEEATHALVLVTTEDLKYELWYCVCRMNDPSGLEPNSHRQWQICNLTNKSLYIYYSEINKVALKNDEDIIYLPTKKKRHHLLYLKKKKFQHIIYF